MPLADQGHTAPRYSLIPRTLIFLSRADQILLLRGAPHKRLWANRYNGLGGHIEMGEDFLSAARRELAEETGLNADLWLCGIITIDTGETPGIGIFVLRGESIQGEMLDSKEGNLEWVPLKQVFNLPLVEDLPTLLPRVLATSRGSVPFAALYRYSSEGKLQISFGE